ncbi:hypothetical protein [Algivirga pacifica]|uniref:Uncharacterized protein n=1 Tax=Algivirga pacifica TaxID=1162670 RepID=A0ABP9DLX6_9BACT
MKLFCTKTIFQPFLTKEVIFQEKYKYPNGGLRLTFKSSLEDKVLGVFDTAYYRCFIDGGALSVSVDFFPSYKIGKSAIEEVFCRLEQLISAEYQINFKFDREEEDHILCFNKEYMIAYNPSNEEDLDDDWVFYFSIDEDSCDITIVNYEIIFPKAIQYVRPIVNTVV